MKKLKLFVSLSLFFIVKINAQFYGHKLYDYSTLPPVIPPSLIASSAYTTGAYSLGYVNGMYCGSNVNGRAFFARKTDMDGNITTVDDFFRNFKVYKNTSCIAGLNTNVPNCAGVTVIETAIGAPTNGSRYALVAALNGPSSGNFLVFATLDQSGNLVNTAFYDFPANVSGIRKPVIAESASAPGNYYICGSYFLPAGETMYALKVNINGAITWSQTYFSGADIEPRALIESPHSPTELIIVGRVEPDPNQPPFLARVDDGFFLKLSAAAGNIILFNVYGEDLVLGEHQGFSSVAPAFSTFGGSFGFVIGGFSEALSNSPMAKGTWMLKVDQNGTH